ncbi:MAG: nucleoside hydrolase [Deltaproteobacteria bacterium]|nr:nucleoside hydrolase [Deltaproteobacteria bacterium]
MHRYRKRLVRTLFLASAVLLGAGAPCRGGATGRARRAIVLFDGAFDDLAALLVLANSAESDLLGVVASPGTQRPWDAARLARGLLDELGLAHVPVWLGRERTLDGRDPPVAWRAAAQGLLDLYADIPTERFEEAIAGMHAALGAAREPVDVLALSPLTDLAALLETHPRDADRIAIVHAAALGGDLQPGFNFRFDPQAAERVARAGARMILYSAADADRVTLGPDFLFEREIQAGQPHSTVSGRYELLPLLARILTRGARIEAGMRFAVWDLVPATAWLEPDLAGPPGPLPEGVLSPRTDAERPRGCEHRADGAGAARNGRGAVPSRCPELVRLRASAAEVQRAIRERLVVRRVPDTRALERFHGHLGPNTVLGAVMGLYARSLLQAAPNFGIAVHYRGPLEPPRSCFIDGLSFATGATPGKANLHLAEAASVRVRFERSDAKGGLEMVFAPGLRERVEAMSAPGADLERGCAQLLREPPASLFEIVAR